MKKKILIILLTLIFIYCIGGVIYSIVVNQRTNKDEKNNILTINNYHYKIDEDLVTELYKSEFKSLKNNLESEEIDIKNYASSIAKLYIIDLYTMSNKKNKYDITSSQYVNSLVEENYRLKVSETIYKYIEDSSERKQELPEVSEVFINNIEESTYLLDDIEYDSYIITVNWLYNKDFGYDTDALLTLINKDNIISVIEEKRVEKNS